MAAPASVIPSRSSRKLTLWIVLFLVALFVIIFSEIPLLHTGTMYDPIVQLIKDRFVLFPHAICGIVALLIGPLQFSSRLRRRNLALHRTLGRIYVYAVFIAASIAVYLVWGRPTAVATLVQAGTWVVCTLAALLTARNRHIVQHRQWMIRSYAMTFTFMTLRLLNPWPRYWNMSDGSFVVTVVLGTFMSVFVPDIVFSWRELTTRRA